MPPMLSFEDALAQALDRCSDGEAAQYVAACYPEYDILPYLLIAQKIQSAPMSEAAPSPEWMQRSLLRLLQRESTEAGPAASQA
jgi:hypothetical protein